MLSVITALTALMPARAENESRTGYSGYPVPRFVALKKDEVYGRAGPGLDVVVIYKKRGLPVKVIAETSDNVWRRVEDHMGRRVWINRSMLAENRHAVAMQPSILFAGPTQAALPRARIEPGVMAALEECEGGWCRIKTKDYRGWTEASTLWGAGL
ncbi:SH3 domain-containing protein [Parvularcula maris]|uniref:SH3 domain-containing protein n=1 Tax=Parvularcula maris TaxID=2965077 RepID=A0A9X2L7X2_9PROT|nr:SH3 domain-containing protein [Parvularcula maris]MCQ8184735.1 SH3 domain-containing protein [Parvularcula maris]